MDPNDGYCRNIVSIRRPPRREHGLQLVCNRHPAVSRTTLPRGSTDRAYTGVVSLVLSFPGVVSSSIANPTDVLKVRMQAANDSVRQKGMLRCFADIYQQEGVRGLWRVSVEPGVDRDVLLSLTHAKAS